MVRPEYLPPLAGMRERIATLVESPSFVRAITGLIFVNAITLGLETEPSLTSRYGGLLTLVDRAILVVFTGELLLKLYAYRLGFFRSGWNVFDLSIVSISWFPMTGALSVLRAFRVLRTLRLLSVVPQMRRIVTALGHSIPGMLSVVGILLLVFYVASVLATRLFGMHPDPQMHGFFGSIGDSAFTLFQVMTLESWSMAIVRPTMEYFPWAWLFFVPFIIITSFMVLNLFIGIIVDALQVAQLRPRETDKREIKQFTAEEAELILRRLDELHAEVRTLRDGRDRT